ncbi:MAG: AmmeMemoRadiSam system protein B [Thaumarchaeota archaeon]|nr:AmmeMemoRadiSam system protein B [Nitrososphaerota archaeon]
MRARAPAAAGTFYPLGSDALGRAIRDASSRDARAPNHAASRCAICPHAGYEYSAHVACHSIRAIAESGARGPVIVIGPEHAGAGSGASVSTVPSWSTPLGEATVDQDAARELAAAGGPLSAGEEAHAGEHSIEVLVPLLQDALGKSLRIVPVAMSDQDAQTALAVGRAAADLATARGGSVVASSDLTHYEPEATAAKKDSALLERVLALDAQGMYGTLASMRVSACGYGPIAAAIAAARRMGAPAGRLLRYATSAEAGGPRDSVVGYASVVFA